MPQNESSRVLEYLVRAERRLKLEHVKGANIINELLLAKNYLLSFLSPCSRMASWIHATVHMHSATSGSGEDPLPLLIDPDVRHDLDPGTAEWVTAPSPS